MMRPWKGQKQSSPEVGHRCWTVTSITGIEEAPHLGWGYGGWGRHKFSQGLLCPSYIKAKGCAEKEKYKTDPTLVPPYPESPS